MYSNYQPSNLPNNQFPNYKSSNMMPYGNQYPNSISTTSSIYTSSPNSINSLSSSMNSDNRLVGGFLGPFILGGITGGLVAPAFYPRPYYGPYRPYPYYGPYYR